MCRVPCRRCSPRLLQRLIPRSALPHFLLLLRRLRPPLRPLSAQAHFRRRCRLQSRRRGPCLNQVPSHRWPRRQCQRPPRHLRLRPFHRHFQRGRPRPLPPRSLLQPHPRCPRFRPPRRRPRVQARLQRPCLRCSLRPLQLHSRLRPQRPSRHRRRLMCPRLCLRYCRRPRPPWPRLTLPRRVPLLCRLSLRLRDPRTPRRQCQRQTQPRSQLFILLDSQVWCPLLSPLLLPLQYPPGPLLRPCRPCPRLAQASCQHYRRPPCPRPCRR